MDNRTKTRIMKRLGIKLSLEDQLRKEVLEMISRSYEDTHPLSFILISIKTIANKY